MSLKLVDVSRQRQKGLVGLLASQEPAILAPALGVYHGIGRADSFDDADYVGNVPSGTRGPRRGGRVNFKRAGGWWGSAPMGGSPLGTSQVLGGLLIELFIRPFMGFVTAWSPLSIIHAISAASDPDKLPIDHSVLIPAPPILATESRRVIHPPNALLAHEQAITEDDESGIAVLYRRWASSRLDWS